MSIANDKSTIEYIHFPYFENDNKIYKIEKKGEKKISVFICSKIFINKKVIDENKNTKYEVELYNGLTDSVFLVDGSVLNSKPKIDVLTDKGFVFESRRYNDVNSYLSKCAMNAKTVMIHKKTGWNSDNTGYYLNTFLSLDDKSTIKSEYNGYLDIAPHGDEQEYLQMLKTEVFPNDGLSFVFVLGFVSPLLELLNKFDNRGSIVFNLSNESSKGKTTAEMLAVSVFSNPAFGKGTITSFNSTQIALQEFVAKCNSLLVGIDELGSSSIKDFQTFLFQISSGQSRMRMTEIDNRTTYNNVVITTAEDLMIDSSSRNGEKVRIFEICDELTVSAENSEKIKKTVLSNYALLGEKFIKYILSLGVEKIISDHLQCKNELLDSFNSSHYEESKLTRRTFDKFAIILLAAKYINSGLNLKLETDIIIQYLIKIERQQSETILISKNAFDCVMSYYLNHIDHFPKNISNISRNIEGIVDNKNGKAILYFQQSIVDKILTKNNFNPNVIKKKWHNEGRIIVTNEEDANNRIHCRYCPRKKLCKNSSPIPCYAFIIDDKFEDDSDSVSSTIEDPDEICESF